MLLNSFEDLILGNEQCRITDLKLQLYWSERCLNDQEKTCLSQPTGLMNWFNTRGFLIIGEDA